MDAILLEVLAILQHTTNLVIEAPPGAGKTTRVPPAVLGLVGGEVIVLEPRRIAARLAARRVAWERGEEVGGTVGYQVRFEERIGPRTRLRFVTEGILTRRLLTDPTLKGIDAIVLDEFHERHLDSDLALALLKRLQRTRPEIRIVVIGEIKAGAASGQIPEITSGKAAAIMTGAAAPAGADAVVMVEYTSRAGERVEITRCVAAENVSAGSEAKRGERLLSPGARIATPSLQLPPR